MAEELSPLEGGPAAFVSEELTGVKVLPPSEARRRKRARRSRQRHPKSKRPPRTGLTTREAAARVGARIGAINEWVRAGVIKPSVRSSRKQGDGARWSDGDVALLRRLFALRDLWASRSQGEMIDVLKGAAVAKAGELVVVGPRGSVRLRRGATAGDAARKVGCPFVVVDPATCRARPQLARPDADGAI